jgi:AcrR family transcriptional regulator
MIRKRFDITPQKTAKSLEKFPDSFTVRTVLSTSDPRNGRHGMMSLKSEEIAVNPKRSSAREAILNAAGRVIADMGARHMTLDAVAREAQVSKGGLLYHFPTKDALLVAMVEDFCGRLAEAAPFEGGKEPRDSLALLKDLIAHRILAHSQKGDMRMAHSMIAAVTERPSLLDPLTAYHSQMWSRVKEGPQPDKAILSWLALEGLLFLEIFNTSPFVAGEREKIIRRILGLLDEAKSEPAPASAD